MFNGLVVSRYNAILLACCLVSSGLRGEGAEPVDKNTSGAMVGGNVYFGQAISVGDSSPGLAILASAEAGWGFARDTWGRTEVTAELGTGSLDFKKKSADRAQVDISLPFYVLAKFGYGYSIGNHAFAIWRVGVGPAFAKYSQKAAGVSEKTDRLNVGFAGTFGMDFVAPATDALSFVGGAHIRRMTFNIGDISSGSGTRDLGSTYQINAPVMNLGLRYVL